MLFDLERKEDRKEIYEEILHKIKEKYSEYEVYINLDLDI